VENPVEGLSVLVGEEFGQEGVFRCGVFYQCCVEVTECVLGVVHGSVVLRGMGAEDGSCAVAEDFDATADVEGIVGGEGDGFEGGEEVGCGLSGYCGSEACDGSILLRVGSSWPRTSFLSMV
jgi:hypothetical protein